MATKPTPAAGAKKKPAAKSKATAKFEEDMAKSSFSAADAAGSTIAGRLIAEFIGTFILMIMGLGTAMLAALVIPSVAPLAVAAAFAVTLVALIVAAGHVSGAHFNPGVTIGAWIAGRFAGRDVLLYIAVQVLGAVTAVTTLKTIMSSHPNIDAGAGSTQSVDLVQAIAITHGDSSPLGFGLGAALAVEFLVAGLLVAAVLSATSKRAPKGQAPFTIGMTLGILVLFAIPVTNGSVNPARATATWLLGDDRSWEQFWPWWVAALAAGAFVGLMYRAFGPEEDLVEVTDSDN